MLAQCTNDTWRCGLTRTLRAPSCTLRNQNRSSRFQLKQTEVIKSLQLVGQAAEFKFESKFEPLPVIWQFLRRLFQTEIEGFGGNINGQALGAALLH